MKISKRSENSHKSENSRRSENSKRSEKVKEVKIVKRVKIVKESENSKGSEKERWLVTFRLWRCFFTILKLSRLFGNLSDCLKTFQPIQKQPRVSEN